MDDTHAGAYGYESSLHQDLSSWNFNHMYATQSTICYTRREEAMNPFVTRLVLAVLIFGSHAILFAQNVGSSGAFTRSGFAGPKYIAFGSVAEAYSDDLFAIYWNPAGLASLHSDNTQSPDAIRKKTEKGDVSGITEEDLLRFSDSSDNKVLQFGASGALVDANRKAFFGGAAFTMLGGALGAGVYTIESSSIREYDTAGNRTGTGNYQGSVGFLSYGRNVGVSSFGISLKGLNETVSNAQYAGASCDIGVRAEVLPFIKVGFVAQDLGIGLYPVSGHNLKDKYAFGSPTLRSSVFMESRATSVSLGFGIERHIEQNKFIYSAGVRYDPMDDFFMSLGFHDESFSAGAGMRIWKSEMWYAVSYDDPSLTFQVDIE